MAGAVHVHRQRVGRGGGRRLSLPARRRRLPARRQCREPRRRLGVARRVPARSRRRARRPERRDRDAVAPGPDRERRDRAAGGRTRAAGEQAQPDCGGRFRGEESHRCENRLHRRVRLLRALSRERSRPPIVGTTRRGRRHPGGARSPGLAAARGGTAPVRARARSGARRSRHSAVRQFPRAVRGQDERGVRLRWRPGAQGAARGVRADPASRARDPTVGAMSDAPGPTDCGVRWPAAATPGLPDRSSRRRRGVGHVGHHRALCRVRGRRARREARRGARDASDRTRVAALRPRAGQRRGAPRGGDRRSGQCHDRAGRRAQRLAASAVRASVRRIRAARGGRARVRHASRGARRPARRAGRGQPPVAAHRVRQPHSLGDLRLGVRRAPVRLRSRRALQRAQSAPRPGSQLRGRALLQGHRLQHGEGGGSAGGVAHPVRPARMRRYG